MRSATARAFASRGLKSKPIKSVAHKIIINKQQQSVRREAMGNQFRSVAFITCLKTFLFVFNFMFWLAGLLILVIGLWAEFDLYKYMELSPDFSGTAPLVVIGVSGLSLIISSIAFSCIVKGQPVLLYIYGGFMICIFMMEVGMCSSIVCFRDTFAQGLYDGLTQTIKNYDSKRTNLDIAQTRMHCCGVTNYTDWMKMSPQRVIPTSCCIDTTHCVTANYNDVYQRGCFEVIAEYVKTNMTVIVAVAVLTSILPLFGAVVACCLANYIRSSQYDVIA
ncbi:unnamed protein product [Leptosia nina]|uniref:Tetraspanin n=1 Tax=Leptosia nina TaxID=320188 RepID=A0AAV1JKW9_9NEOP